VYGLGGDGDGVGLKLLKKLGWKGGGLGKNETGIINPVEVTLRSDKVGLGMDEEKYAVLPSDTYQQATKKKAMARFESIQW